MTTTYHSETYGTGEIVSRCNGEIVVRFPEPPGMKRIEGAQICPVIHIQESKDEQ